MIIYLIKNLNNSKVYVGQSTGKFEARRKRHINDLIKQKHCNAHMQCSWNRGDVFEWHIIDYAVTHEDLNIREKFWIKFYNSYNKDFGYNKTFGGDAGRLTPESIAKMSNSLKGRVGPNKGKQFSEESRRKMSLAAMGRVSPNKGKQFSDEFKQKVRNGMMGNKNAKRTK